MSDHATNVQFVVRKDTVYLYLTDYTGEILYTL